MLKKLKINKAAGTDGIVNEYISVTVDIFLPVYVKLFNLVFDNGAIVAVTTLRQMPHTEIDYSFKSELLGGGGGGGGLRRLAQIVLPCSARRLSVFASFIKESSYGHGYARRMDRWNY